MDTTLNHLLTMTLIQYFSVQTTLMEDIDYGFKKKIRHRIVLEQKELCHAQTQFYYPFRQEVRDINRIENSFRLVSKKLRLDALELGIQFESYKQFEERVIKTIRRIPVDVINKTILPWTSA